MTQIIKVKRLYTDEEAEVKFKGKFLKETDCKILITEDTDAYDMEGNLLFRFRKNVLPIETLMLAFFHNCNRSATFCFKNSYGVDWHHSF